MIFAPASVDVIIDGNLANVEIATNFDVFIGSNPPIYTNKSFGVPGIINNIINIYSIFLGFLNNLLFSILSIFYLLQKLYINSFPYFRTAKKIIVVVINTENIKNIVPKNPP